MTRSDCYKASVVFIKINTSFFNICNKIGENFKIKMIISYFFTMLRWIERGACYAQGKGYGSATIAQEVSAVNSLMRGDPKLMVDIGGNKGDYSAELRSRFKESQIRHLIWND